MKAENPARREENEMEKWGSKRNSGVKRTGKKIGGGRGPVIKNGGSRNKIHCVVRRKN